MTLPKTLLIVAALVMVGPSYSIIHKANCKNHEHK
jgi:hypothetical protein